MLIDRPDESTCQVWPLYKFHCFLLVNGICFKGFGCEVLCLLCWGVGGRPLQFFLKFLKSWYVTMLNLVALAGA